MPYALKTINLDRYSPEAWRVLLGDMDGTGEKLGVQQAYEQVGIVFRAVDIRAGAVQHLPWAMERRGRPVHDPVLLQQLTVLLYMLETLYVCYGAAYALKIGEPPLGLRWIMPTTITPKANDARGLVGFERRIGDKTTVLPVDRVCYTWAPSITQEIGPGPGPLVRALPDAAIRHHLDAYLAAFFERGALRPTLWLFDGNPTPQELERVESWTQRVVSGVKNAFRHIGLRKVATVQQIGDPLSQAYDVELSRSTIEHVLTTLGVPASLVLANAANYATAEQDALNFILRTVLPQAERYIAMLAPHMQQLGYTLRVNEAQIEELQKREMQKAAALVALTGGPVMTQSEARERMELPPIASEPQELARLALLKQLEIVKAAIDATLPLETALALAGLDSDLPKPSPPPPMLPPPPDANHASIRDDDESAEQAWRAWQRKALKRLREGKSAAVPFVSDALAADDAAWVADELTRCDDEHGVRDVFLWVKKEPGTGLTPRERALYEKVLAVLTRYRGEVVVAVIDGNTLDLSALPAMLRGALQADLVAAALDVMSDYADSIGPDFDPATAASTLQTWSAEYTQRVAGNMSETTRTMVEKTVSAWRATPGATRQQLIDMLAPAFGARRAETIAITSATEAAAQAAIQYQTYLEANGLSYVRVWRTVNDEGVCAICDPLNGKRETEWNERFPMGPPAHARCRCAVSLVRAS